HMAAQASDVRRVREILDSGPSHLNRGDRAGGTPLHRAVAASARDVVKLLLDRGANIHAIHGTGAGAPGGFSPHDVEAIDIAIWGGFGQRRPPPWWRIAVKFLQHWLWYRRIDVGGPVMSRWQGCYSLVAPTTISPLRPRWGISSAS